MFSNDLGLFNREIGFLRETLASELTTCLQASCSVAATFVCVTSCVGDLWWRRQQTPWVDNGIRSTQSSVLSVLSNQMFLYGCWEPSSALLIIPCRSLQKAQLECCRSVSKKAKTQSSKAKNRKRHLTYLTNEHAKKLLFYKNGVKSLSLKFKFSLHVSAHSSLLFTLPFSVNSDVIISNNPCLCAFSKMEMTVCNTWRLEESGSQTQTQFSSTEGFIIYKPSELCMCFYRIKLIHPTMSSFSRESLGAVFSEQLNRSIHWLINTGT